MTEDAKDGTEKDGKCNVVEGNESVSSSAAVNVKNTDPVIPKSTDSKVVESDQGNSSTQMKQENVVDSIITEQQQKTQKRTKITGKSSKTDQVSSDDGSESITSKTVNRVVHRAIDTVLTSAVNLRRRAESGALGGGAQKRCRTEISEQTIEDDAKAIHRKILDSIYRETYQSGGVLDYEECEGNSTGTSQGANRNSRKLAANRLAALRCRKRKEMYKTALEQVLFHMTKQVLQSAQSIPAGLHTNSVASSTSQVTAPFKNNATTNLSTRPVSNNAQTTGTPPSMPVGSSLYYNGTPGFPMLAQNSWHTNTGHLQQQLHSQMSALNGLHTQSALEQAKAQQARQMLAQLMQQQQSIGVPQQGMPLHASALQTMQQFQFSNK